MALGFTQSNVEKNFFIDSVAAEKRGTTLSFKDAHGIRAAKTLLNDTKVHDANFAFLTTTLAKLHKDLKEPKYYVTWSDDVPVDMGGGFVDYVEYYTVDWAGIMNEFRNVMGNNANYIPRVNAGLNQMKVNVFTFELAYDLRFVELEKMKQLTLQKSLNEIYENIIVAQWDLFVQQVAYLGMNGGQGLFNHKNVAATTIDNSGTTGKGFQGLDDKVVVAWFNGLFAKCLADSNMNPALLPDTFLVPTFVGSDLSARMSQLYTNTLRQFIVEHNLGSAETDGKLKVSIKTRPALDALGDAGKGRIVAYRKDKTFVRIDMPYPMQHYITLPNIDKMCYTSAFVGQVSEIQLPYNTSADEAGIVTYWDFSN